VSFQSSLAFALRRRDTVASIIQRTRYRIYLLLIGLCTLPQSSVVLVSHYPQHVLTVHIGSTTEHLTLSRSNADYQSPVYYKYDDADKSNMSPVILYCSVFQSPRFVDSAGQR